MVSALAKGAEANVAMSHHKVTVIKDRPLRHQITKQHSPAWLPGSRAAENGGIKRSKSSIREQQNQSEAIGLAKRPGKIDHSIENLAKQIVGRKIIVQTRAKPASITKPKATAITSKGYPTCFWENQTNCSYNPLKDPPLVATSQSGRSRTASWKLVFRSLTVKRNCLLVFLWKEP